MGKTLIFLFVGFLLFSCKKDKTQAICQGVNMEGEKSRFVGTWRWYNTTVEQWFDVGPSIFHNYTPQNQGFEYYFTLSSIGEFKGYRNDTLVQSFLLSNVEAEHYDTSSVNIVTNVAKFLKDCSSEATRLYQLSNNFTNDSIFTLDYPLKFNDEENHLASKRNFFVKE